MNLITSLKPERVFLVLSSIFGIVYLLLTPPFQSPDENRHFYRAYHISQGSFVPAKMDGRVGGFLPRKVKNSLKPFSEMQGQMERITSRKEIVSIINSKVDNTNEFVDFPSVAVYTPISYIPQAVGIRIATFFSDSPIIALYAGRLMALMCWILAIYFAIRITPILKWLFVALALLPTSLYISASVSSDTITNLAAFLLLATILKHAFSEQKQTKKEFWILGLLVLFLASAKFIYSPLILLFFLIPLRNFEGKKQFFLRFGALGVIAFLAAFCWPIIQGVGYVPYADYNLEYRDTVNLLACSDIHDQMTYILSNGTYLFEVLWSSLGHSFDKYYEGFIGNFGWGEAPLSTFWLNFGYLGLLLVALFDGRPEVKINGARRALVFTTFGGIFCLVIVSQLLIWTCTGNDVVGNLQGRYFMPIGPLFFFIFYRSSNKFSKYLPIGVAIFSLTLLLVSTQSIYNRFYVPIQYTTEVVYVNHEEGGGDVDFETSVSGIKARNGHSRSDEKSRSGKYSSKISSTSQYGTLVSFENCNGGDAVEIEAWRSGPSGLVIISAGDGKMLYQAEGKVDSTSNEWRKMEFWVRIPPAIKNEEVSCYLGYLTDTDSCYFDDIKITLSRQK